MKKTVIILGLALVYFSSCKKNLPDIGGTKAQSLANEWWVTLDSVGIPDYYGIGHFKIATYNTAADNDSIWVDDFKNGYGMKVKAKADFTNLTFSQANSSNLYYNPSSPGSFPLTVNITEGQVFTKKGHSRAGNVVDSIHMKVEFSDDPGFIYEMNGTARTMLIEDEY